MADAGTPRILLEHEGPIAVLTLNNPESRNAFLDDMLEGIRGIWPQLADDPAVRVVIVTGAGKAFSAGGDIPGFIRRYEDLEFRRASFRSARKLMDAMAEFHKPVIAAVNGAAVGLGCSIAIGCDIVLMAESSYLADTHVNVGLVAGDGGAATWPLMTSILRAKEYLFTGDRIPPAEAVALGLANRVVPDDQLMAEARTLAAKLAAQPQQALQETKRALNLHLQAAIARVAPFALAAESESFETDDIRRTIENFKSSPN